MSEAIEQSYNVHTSSNVGYNSAAALQIRLDPTPIIEDVEMYLRATKQVTYRDADTGQITRKYEDTGKPKANDCGVHAILNWVSTIINPQVVQGNFVLDGPKQSSMFETYLVKVHENFAATLMTNMYNWEVIEEDYDYLVDFIMNIIVPFMTRLLDNKERDGYAQQLQYRETNVDKEGSKFNLLGLGKK